MGTNSKGASGLFPSNYVELVQGGEEEQRHEEAPAAHDEPTPAPAAARPAEFAGPTATALYDYEAAEDNELSFEEGAKITELVRSCTQVSYRELANIPTRHTLMKIGGTVVIRVIQGYSLRITWN